MTRKPNKACLDSFHKDKAVQDNIVESWLCVDLQHYLGHKNIQPSQMTRRLTTRQL
jgi:hypothetical protein